MIRAALSATLTLLLLPAVAGAASYCVGSPAGCPEGALTRDTLALALTDAETSAEADDIHLGAGLFEDAAGFAYDQAGVATNDVRIHGEGEATVLGTTGTKAGGFHVVTLVGAGADETFIEDVAIRLPERSSPDQLPGGVALEQAAARGIQVHDAPGATEGGGVGVSLSAGAELLSSTLALATSGANVAVRVAGASHVRDVEVTSSDVGILVESAGAGTAERIAVRAASAAVICADCPAYSVANALLFPGADGTGLESRSTAASPAAVLRASHVTVVGPPGDDSATGAFAHASAGGAGAQLDVDNSIITATATAVRQSATAPGQASVNVASSHYDATTNQLSGPGAINETAVANQSPGFVDAATGDYRLVPGAPQIDAGRPDPLVASTMDSGGLDRTADGDADGADEPDIGAHEYQPVAPAAAISGADRAEEESPLALSGAASSDGGEPGDDIVSYAWRFGDGSTGNGAEIAHIYLDPGTFTVTLTVTDRSGRTATATKQVTVTARPAAPPASTASAALPAPITPPRPAADRTPPTIVGFLKAARFRRGRGTTLRVGLSERARVRIAFTRKGRTLKRSTRTMRAGTTTINLRALTRRLRPADYTITLTATDAAGNVSRKVSLKARVRP